MRRANGNFRPEDEFNPGDRMLVRGRKKCANANARVRVSLDVDGEFIGSGRATDRGAYLIRTRIPRSTSFGTHTVIVRTSGLRYESQIEVVPEEGSEGAGFSGTAAPMLVAWVALGGLIAAFFVGARRRRQVATVAAVPQADDVPKIDTSSFMPFSPTKAAQRGGQRTRVAAKPKSQRKKTSPRARKKSAAKPKPAPPAGTSAQPRSPAKRRSRGTATTKRSGSKAPRRDTGKAKPKQSPKRNGNGPTD